ncbi:outer membrane beta-barrel family protein, partial [Xanthovirga aplysinae]|uniref:outer membrane beta-barrel family protein n=1 Tax=Xanthovirga aplysinae TaxID=2529853 RepID=UPI0012BBF405
MKKISTLLITLAHLLPSSDLLAQTKLSNEITIHGKVTNDKGEFIEIGNILILSLKDSTLIKGNYFFDGQFEIQGSFPTSALLMVSSMGFKDYYSPLMISKKGKKNTINMGQITIKENLKELEAVEIIATKPVFRQEAGKLIVDVKNSIAAGSGTAIELLKKTPGVITNQDNSVSIFGKGKATVLINGRKVPASEMLTNLSADQIQEIEIISSPSAKYEAEGKGGVINIITNDRKIEGSFAKISGTLTKAIYQRAYLVGTYAYQKGKFNLYSSYSNNPHKTRTIDEYHRSFGTNMETSSLQMKNRVETIRQYLNAHNYNLSTDYAFNEKNSLSLQYRGQLYQGDIKTLNSNRIGEGEIMQTEFLTHNKKKKFFGNNSFNFNYNLKPSKGETLSLTADYANTLIKSEDVIEENISALKNRETSTNDKRNESNNLIRLFSFQADYSKYYDKPKLKIETGLRWASSSNNSKIDFIRKGENNNWEKDPSISNGFDYKENIGAAYFQLDKRFGKLKINTGLRGELTQPNGYSLTLQKQVIEGDYFQLFPSFSIGFDLSKDLNIYLAYSKRISRPSYRDMDPSVDYIDSLTYFKGNPYLKAETNQGFEAALTYKEYASIKVGYTSTQNAIKRFVAQDENNPELSYSDFRNIPKAETYWVSLTLPYQNSWWTTYNSFGWEYNTFNYKSVDTFFQLRKPLWYIYSYQEFKLPGGILAEITFQWFSPGVDGIFEFESSYTMSTGLRKSFIKDKLDIRLIGNDIFNTYREAGNTQIQGVKINYGSQYDDTYLRLSFTYKLGRLKST